MGSDFQTVRAVGLGIDANSEKPDVASHPPNPFVKFRMSKWAGNEVMKEVAHSGFFHFPAVYEGVVVASDFHFLR